jgi:hypothetical protein
VIGILTLKQCAWVKTFEESDGVTLKLSKKVTVAKQLKTFEESDGVTLKLSKKVTVAKQLKTFEESDGCIFIFVKTQI